MQKNISYINSWNFLSKSKLIKQEFKQKSTLLIVPSLEDLKNYSKIFDFLNFDYSKIDNYSNFTELVLNKNGFFIVNSDIFNKKFDTLNQIKYKSLHIKEWEEIKIDEIIKKLNSLNYNFSEFSTSGSYKKLWDILKIYSPDSKKEINISFWWDTIEEITQENISENLKKEKNKLEEIYIWENKALEEIEWKNEMNLSELLCEETFCILDSLDFDKNYDLLTTSLKSFCCFDYVWNKELQIIDLEIKNLKIKNIDEFKEILLNSHKPITVYTRTTKTIKNFLEYNNLENIKTYETNLNNLKSYSDKKNIFICDDIISNIFTKKRLKKNLSADLDLLLKIKTWDLVVHIDHWIWIFKDILKKEIPNSKWQKIIKEYIEIEYLWNDKLFVPITEVSRINKYLWAENPKLTRLNTNEWTKKLSKAKEEVEAIAHELLEIYANRKINSWYAFIEDEIKEDAFKHSFKYTYTDWQSEAIKETLDDMSKNIPMDRLIVWDVWFWKTEIAFNSIYRAFINKKQSIFISPLVVLAYEHFQKAVDRFRWLWLKIEVLTRFESVKQTNEIIKKLASWEIDLVIWTHKLLSDKILYKNLGLIVVDEEHKFWVDDKEKIKKLKYSIDVLSMSATPIPRSLNMALSNLRSISILKTPPFGRQDISTTISRFSERVILEAWTREFERNGQMFFVHNRVSNIENFKIILKNIFPDKKIIITHGQLPWNELEKRIIDFKNKKYDILLSTTVIENGIDFSNVNTIFINDAEKFWLSQIHQLRWRVWRSDKKWYCYLLYKKENLKDDTAKRLKTIVEYSYLWAWFELAIKDLEIRGWWDLLGFRQSWQSSQIWINLYLKMIEEKIEELQKTQSWKDKLKTNTKKINTKIDLNIESYIKDDFFTSELDKINFYREIETIENLKDLNEIITDFKQTNKNIWEQAENLFNLLLLKIYASSFNIERIRKNWVNYQIDFQENISLEKLKEFLNLDKQVKFIVISWTRLRSPIKNFENEEKFLEYLLLLFENKITYSKIKLKKK